MGVWKMRPPSIFQGDRLICWATAIAAWTQVTSGVANLDTEEVIAKFTALKVVTERKTLETVAGMNKVAAEFGLDAERVEGGGSLTADILGPKLKKSHVLAVYRRPGATYLHMVVIYGVDALYVSYMDPMVGSTFSDRIFNFGSGTESVVLLWRR